MKEEKPWAESKDCVWGQVLSVSYAPSPHISGITVDMRRQLSPVQVLRVLGRMWAISRGIASPLGAPSISAQTLREYEQQGLCPETQ